MNKTYYEFGLGSIVYSLWAETKEIAYISMALFYMSEGIPVPIVVYLPKKDINTLLFFPNNTIADIEEKIDKFLGCNTKDFLKDNKDKINECKNSICLNSMLFT